MLFSLFLVQFLLIYFINCDVSPLGNYNNFLNLVQPDFYNFYWNYTGDSIIAEVHVKTQGWVSLGITIDGKLDKSDTMVAWINSDGSSVFVDCYIKNNALYIDQKQNWNLLSSIYTGGYTVIKFSRKINLCDVDSSEDLNIPNSSPYISYSWSSSTPSKYIDYFNNNTNVIQIPLLSSVGYSYKETNTFNQTFNFNNSLPNNMLNMYLCSTIDLSLNWGGTFNNLKRHLIQVFIK
jgi:hypothetical protein